MIVSIFNDVIGPVMRGPSSSHCAAALRIGRLALDLMDGVITEVLVEFDREGSLPSTHDSQGSDMGLFGGLLGWDAADARLPDSMETLRRSGVAIRIETVDTQDPHPNTYRLTLTNNNRRRTLRAISTGGGMMEVIDIDGCPLSMGGDYFETLLWITGDPAAVEKAIRGGMEADSLLRIPSGEQTLMQVKAREFVPVEIQAVLTSAGRVTSTCRLSPVLPVLSRAATSVPFTTCQEMLAYDGGRNIPLWELASTYEQARGDLSAEAVMDKMRDIVLILRRSIAQGLAGTAYDDRVLGFQSGGFQKLMQEGRLLNGGALNRIILYVTALMEVKSSMGVIVAAPTAGACAALPGAVIALAEEMGLDEDAMARALLASGVIGVFIATRWSFAAEVGGCQAEGGSAASMAAAALVSLAGGTLTESVAAASMALQSMIGLICDPIANRVEAPCLGKNVMAAANALSCANMALAGYDPLIPLDEVIETAKQVAKRMPREHRCTNLGGLSITPAAIALEQKLTARKAGCGTGCACG